MFTTEGEFGDGAISCASPATRTPTTSGRWARTTASPAMPEDRIIDGGFLELVRYGVRAPNAHSIVATLPEYDDQTREDRFRVRYDRATASRAGAAMATTAMARRPRPADNYGVGGMTAAGQRGRVWPFFTGERGHYELAGAV